MSNSERYAVVHLLRGGIVSAHNESNGASPSYASCSIADMLEQLWRSTVHVVGGWDPKTAATFVAVGVTIWLARASTRSDRQQLRQSAVIDLNEHAVAWTTEADMYLNSIDGYLAGQIEQSAIGQAAADRVMIATGHLDRALKTASMVMPDFRMVVALTEAQVQTFRFLQLFANQDRPASIEDERRNLTWIVTEGRRIVAEFQAGAGPLVSRGMKLYRLRRGWTFAARKWLASHRSQRSQ